MRICIIRNSEGPMNAQLIRIGTALNKTEHDFFFVTRNRDAQSEGIIEKKMMIDGKKITNYEIQLPAIIGGGVKNIIPLLKYRKILSKWLTDNQDKYDVIHAVDYDTGAVALNMKKKFNKKVVYHIADFYADSRLNIPDILKKQLRKNEYKIINKAETTIICSEDRIDQIDGSMPNNLVIVHNTPPRTQEPFSSAMQLKNKDLRITYVGGLEKKRFIDQVIKVVKDNPSVQLTLAGSIGDARDAIALIDNIPNIDYMGKVSYEKALELYKDADLMFAMYDPNHPNHRYSAANKVYEAMLLGKPIIVSNQTGMDKIVREEDMGYTIDFEAESFSKLLDYLSTNKKELLEKSEKAYQAHSKYSWEVMENRIINLYQKL